MRMFSCRFVFARVICGWKPGHSCEILTARNRKNRDTKLHWKLWLDGMVHVVTCHDMPGNSLHLHVYLPSIPFRHLSELCWTEARRCPLPAREARYKNMICDDMCNIWVSSNDIAYMHQTWWMAMKQVKLGALNSPFAKNMSRTFCYFKLWESKLLARLRNSLMVLVCNLEQMALDAPTIWFPINSKDMYMSPALLSGNICIGVWRPDG